MKCRCNKLPLAQSTQRRWMDVACKCFSSFLCSELVPYTSLATNYSRTLQLRSSRIGGSHDINRVCIAALHTAAASAAVTRAKNGAQAERCSRGTACSQTRGPRTGAGTSTGAHSTTNDAPGAVRTAKGRETLTRGDGAACGAAGWRSGGSGASGASGTSAGSRTCTSSRSVVGART